MPQVETLATTRRPIRDFAQDGGRITWIDGLVPFARNAAEGCELVLHIASVWPLWDAATRLHDMHCSAGALVLGGRQALWAHWFGGAGTQWTTIGTAAAGVRRYTPIAEIGQNDDGTGEFLTSTAADGIALLYGAARWGTEPPNCEPGAAGCRRILAGGGLMRVRGARAVEMLGVPLPALIAVGGARVAVVPADPASPYRWRRVLSLSVVETRALSGELLKRIDVDGRVTAIALSARLLGIVIRQAGVQRLEIRDAASGEARGAAIRLPERTAPELSLSATAAVFRTGRTIRSFELSTRRQRVLAQAAAVPIGLSIEGDRVAWAENIGRRGRIRAVVLSPRALD